MVAVQAAGCAPMVSAFEAGAEHAPRWENAHTIASGVRGPQAIGGFLILRAVRERGGGGVGGGGRGGTAGARRGGGGGGGVLCAPGGAAPARAHAEARR